jgi:Dockerin type I domain
MDPMKLNGPGEDDQSEAPPKLVAALKQLQPRRVFVPPAVDDAVLKAARRHLAKTESTRFCGFRRWLLWPGLATACLLLAALGWTITTQVRTAHDQPIFAREDLNHDGRVDILDAFQLARQLESGPKPAAALDLNGDGVVDRRDAKIIAAHAVKMTKGGRS